MEINMDALNLFVTSGPVFALLVIGFYWIRSRPLVSYNKRFHDKQNANYGATPIPIESSVSKESDLPPNWFSGKDIFELEKRAIFSKTWLYITHSSQFTKPGDYHSLKISGFPIFLIRGKDGLIRAFHNVCRHRAYPVARKSTGSSLALGCRYHGWSYNTYGALVKAPHFEGVDGFDKSQNGLFEIRAYTNDFGFVFVNLEVNGVSEVEDHLLDGFARRHALKDPMWISGQAFDAAFNWKMGVQLKHSISSMKIESSSRSWTKFVTRYFGKKSDSLFQFPNTSIHTIQGTDCWFTLSCLPVTERQTIVRLDLFGKTGDAQVEIQDLTTLIGEKIRELETQYQSTERTEPLPHIPGPEDTHVQKRILESIKAHSKLERSLGTEVYPARIQPRESQRFQQADQLCKDLDCQSLGKDLWW